MGVTSPDEWFEEGTCGLIVPLHMVGMSSLDASGCGRWKSARNEERCFRTVNVVGQTSRASSVWIV